MVELRQADGARGAGKAGGRLTVLLLLAAVNAFNHLDRQLTSILLEPIRGEFGLSDVQLGLLSGLAFAAFYTMLGLPAAIWSVSRGRVALVTAATELWGVMTALCGLTQNFTQLFLARIGVGVGEAGCLPAAHAMISDLYRPSERAGALAVFAAGVNVGVFFSFLVGGYLGQAYGWRTAFLAAGGATVVLAIVLGLAVREPARTHDRPDFVPKGSRAGAMIAETAGLMWRDAVLRHMVLGATLTATVSYGAVGWLPSFLVRTHDVGIAAAGLYLALIIGLGGALGTWFGGAVSDLLRRRDIRWSMWFVGLAYVATKPFAMGFYLVDSLALALALFVLPGMTGAMFQGPSIATLHERVPAKLRPIASALLLVMINFIGLGLGPLIVGMLSQYAFAGAGGNSLRYALVTMQLAGIWGGVHFWLAGRALRSPAAAP